MKKIYTILMIIAVISISSYSQIEKGTFLLGGHANFSIVDDLVFQMNPNSGYFLTDHFCLGLSLPIIYADDQIFWGITPIGRFYLNQEDVNSIFFSGGIGITSILETQNNISQGLLSAGVGYVWFLNKSVGFETIFAANIYENDVVYKIHFGFQIFFNRNN